MREEGLPSSLAFASGDHQMLRRDDFGIDGNGGFGIPPRASESDWIVFRGGVDDVIYPGEVRLIGKLIQMAVNKGDRGIPPNLRPGQVATGFDHAEKLFICETLNLEYEISAEGTETKAAILQIAEESFTLTVPVR